MLFVQAVELLDGSAQGVFLFIEGSLIDKAAHPNDLAGHLRDILAYDEAVGAMIEYARKDGNTLVLQTYSLCICSTLVLQTDTVDTL